MRIYKTIGKNSTKRHVAWSGSKDDAATNRRSMTNAGFKRAEIKTEEIDFVPTKTGTLEMLNENCNN
jgi:hypothetical protein